MSDSLLFTPTRLGHFERLPPEIIIHVFDYLLPRHILYAFFDLNARLRLLTLHHYRLYSSFQLPAANTPFWQRVLPLIGPHIRSLIITNGQLAATLDTLSHLTSLTITSPHGLTNVQIDALTTTNAFARLRTLKVTDEVAVSRMYTGDELDAEERLFRAVFSETNKLELFEYAPRLTNLPYRRLFGVSRQVHLQSLRLHLSAFGDVFTFLAHTPNLRSLHLQSFPPLFDDILEYDDTCGVELQELHIKFNRLRMGPIGSNLTEVDFYPMIRLIFRCSKSLVNLSLNLIELTRLRTRDDYPFNGVKLDDDLLSALPMLKNFALYAKKTSDENNAAQVLATFDADRWSHRAESVGVHQNDKDLYIYTLPFQFDELHGFIDFNRVVFHHYQNSLSTSHLWSKITSLELFLQDGIDLKQVLRSVQVNMPRLTIIKLVDGRDASRVLPEESESFDIVLRSVNALHLQRVPVQTFKRYIVDTLPRVRHLSLISSTLQSVDEELRIILGQRIRRLEFDAYYDKNTLTDQSLTYFTSLEELCLVFTYGTNDMQVTERAIMIEKVLENFPNLKTLSIYAVPCAGCIIYSADQVFEPVLNRLNMETMNNMCEIKRCGQYLRFVRLEAHD